MDDDPVGRFIERATAVGGERLREGHIPALDGLRGLAVIAVIVCHVNWAYGGPFVLGRVNGPLAAAFGCGWVGVDLFFVLSGFLITGILYDAKGSCHYFRNFYARRTLRIMPLYFGFLFFGIFVVPRLPFPGCERLAVSRADATSLALYVYNFRVAFTEHPASYFHAFWSLAIEEHFYLLWPLAVWALNRRPLVRLCLVLAGASFLARSLVVLSGAWVETGFFLTPCRLEGLLAGALVALAWRDPADRARVRRWAGRLVFGSGGLLLGIVLGQGHFIPGASALVVTVGVAGLAAFFAGVLVLALAAAEGGPLRRFLEGGWLRAVGKYSYAIYVFHSLILLAGVRLLSSVVELPLFVAKPAAVLWVLAASLAAAWLSYHLFEKHFLRLKRFFEYHQPARAGAATPSQYVRYSHVQLDPLPAGRPTVSDPLPGGAQ
jgi:peptidoglycan/LPS O-acetylase OafA/YrhL